MCDPGSMLNIANCLLTNFLTSLRPFLAWNTHFSFLFDSLQNSIAYNWSSLVFIFEKYLSFTCIRVYAPHTFYYFHVCSCTFPCAHGATLQIQKHSFQPNFHPILVAWLQVISYRKTAHAYLCLTPGMVFTCAPGIKSRRARHAKFISHQLNQLIWNRVSNVTTPFGLEGKQARAVAAKMLQMENTSSLIAGTNKQTAIFGVRPKRLPL